MTIIGEGGFLTRPLYRVWEDFYVNKLSADVCHKFGPTLGAAVPVAVHPSGEPGFWGFGLAAVGLSLSPLYHHGLCVGLEPWGWGERRGLALGYRRLAF